MKRILSILTLLLSLTFSFTSCKKDNTLDKDSLDKTYILNFLEKKGISIRLRDATDGYDNDIYGKYQAVIDSVSGSIGRGDAFPVIIEKGTDKSNAIWTTDGFDRQTVLLTKDKQIILYSEIGDSSDQLIDILKYEMSGDSLDLTGYQYKGIPADGSLPDSSYHRILLIRGQ